MKKPVGRLLYPNTGWYFAAMLLFTAAAAAVGQYILAGGALFVTLIMFIISRARLSGRKRQLMSYVQTATDSVGISVHAGSVFPMAVIRLPENEIIWGNPSFFTITGLSDTACYQTLDAVVPGFSTSWLREGRSELPGDQIIGGRRYRIYGNYVKSEDDATTVQLATIYFADMTEMFNVRDEFLRTRPIVSIILIDNYDELTANLSDSAISTLDAQLNDVVANWTAGLEALCRKIERNRYLLIFESKDLARLQDGRFSILEDVRHVTTSGGMSATISLGSAVGLLCLCRVKERPARIVIDLQKNACQSLIAELKAAPGCEDLFISGQDALVEADNRSLLIVVDTNRPEQVECRPLLESISRVAVIDHHRRAADYIEQPVLNLHEPYASSASELVTELLQYAVSQRDVRPLEAQALLAGIVLDTKNFSVRTGSRTFESAAYLRKAGADPVEVKKLFQTDLDDTLTRYRVVQAARLYRGELAIACLDETITRTIAAQAADELINISGITASFVLFPDGEQVIISARSIGSCNVQVVLEKLGGGGNGATAGAQIKGKPLRQVLQDLVGAIDAFYA